MLAIIPWNIVLTPLGVSWQHTGKVSYYGRWYNQSICHILRIRPCIFRLCLKLSQCQDCNSHNCVSSQIRSKCLIYTIYASQTAPSLFQKMNGSLVLSHFMTNTEALSMGSSAKTFSEIQENAPENVVRKMTAVSSIVSQRKLYLVKSNMLQVHVGTADTCGWLISCVFTSCVIPRLLLILHKW